MARGLLVWDHHVVLVLHISYVPTLRCMHLMDMISLPVLCDKLWNKKIFLKIYLKILASFPTGYHSILLLCLLCCVQWQEHRRYCDCVGKTTLSRNHAIQSSLVHIALGVGCFLQSNFNIHTYQVIGVLWHFSKYIWYKQDPLVLAFLEVVRCLKNLSSILWVAWDQMLHRGRW